MSWWQVLAVFIGIPVAVVALISTAVLLGSGREPESLDAAQNASPVAEVEAPPSGDDPDSAELPEATDRGEGSK